MSSDKGDKSKRSLEVENRGTSSATKVSKHKSSEVPHSESGIDVRSAQPDEVEVALAYSGTGTMAIFRTGTRRVALDEEFVFRLPSLATDVPGVSQTDGNIAVIMPSTGSSVAITLPRGYAIIGGIISATKETLLPGDHPIVWRFGARLGKIHEVKLLFS
jgi:hypothetical protein